MKKHYVIFVVSLLFIYACGEEKKANESKTGNIENASEEEEPVTEETEEEEISFEGEYYFRGMIDHRYPFQMHITVLNDSATGAYYYESQKKELSLKGVIQNGQMRMDEMYKNKITGTFTSAVLTHDSISGEWKSPKGRQFSFVLFKGEEAQYNNALGVVKQNWTSAEFMTFKKKFKPVVFPFNFEPSSEDEMNGQFTNEDVKRFMLPEYDPNDPLAFTQTFSYGHMFETEKYVALLYREHYYPGAFGIDNYTIYLKTFTPDGKLIDTRDVACLCYHNSLGFYSDQTEKFTLNQGEIIITGTAIYFDKPQEEEYDEELMLEDAMNRTEINRKLIITADGKITTVNKP